MSKFDHTYSYKLIYVFSMPYETHKGLLKIGEATIKTASNPTELLPNSHQLNQAAKLRIEQYIGTASTQYKLEYTELATMNVGGYLMPFKDKDVHAVLMNSRVHKVQPNGSTGNEWFETNLETVKNAIKAVKDQIEAAIYHECGHATVASVIKEGSVGLITVQTDGRNDLAGITRLCTEFTRRPENIIIALAGKAAVEIFYQGRCGSGCQSDLLKACDYIREGIIGNATYGIGLLEIGNSNMPSSESLNMKTEAVAQAELERYLFIAKDILMKNKDYFMKLVDELRNKKYLLYSDIKKVRDSVSISETYIQ